MSTVLSTSDAARAARLRRSLARDGYILQKSRARNWSLDNHGGYRVVDASTNFISVGERYDCTLDDIERWANEPA